MKLEGIKRKASVKNGLYEICEALELLDDNGNIPEYVVLYENHPDNNTGVPALFVCEKNLTPSGACYDSFHFVSTDSDLIEIIRSLQILAKHLDYLDEAYL